MHLESLADVDTRVVDGIKMLKSSLLQSLAQAGVRVVDPIGQSYNYDTMLAVSTAPTDKDDMRNTVSQTLSEALFVDDECVRPASVIVFV